MILTCPSCSTQYVVKDGAIPPQGRQVRCAACKHSWHQDPDPSDFAGAAETPAEPRVEPPVAEYAEPEIPPPPAAEQWSATPHPAEDAAESEDGAGSTAEPPAGQRADYGSLGDNRGYEAVDTDVPDEPDAGDESLAEAALIEPRSGPEAEERAYEKAMVSGMEAQPGDDGWQPPAPAAEAEIAAAADTEAAADDDFSPFADAEEAPRRRPFVTILVLALVIVVLAALFWFAAPAAWKARVGLSAAGASPLALVMTHMDRQKLESGNELLTVTGRVINPTSEEQKVPPLQAQLKSANGQLVYSWTIAPPAQRLAPGASASFNSAEVNVPPGGDAITLTLSQAKS